MIRFLSISKAASGCILTLMFGTISIGTQTRPHHTGAHISRGDASHESCSVACRVNNQDSNSKCHWLKEIHGNEAWSYHILTRTFTWSTKQIEKLVILGGTTSTSLFVTQFLDWPYIIVPIFATLRLPICCLCCCFLMFFWHTLLSG